MVQTYDLATAWCWQYDEDFVGHIDRECVKRGIRSYLIHTENLSETLQQIEKGELRFKIFFDRASDQEEAFVRLVEEVQKRRVKMINRSSLLELAIDKAAMQRKLVAERIDVPYTVILPPWYKKLPVPSFPWEKVGTPFVVKPACGGCGDGVVKDARTTQDIQKARQQFPHDRYLLQERIEPALIDERRAWFRVFFVFGQILPCWWDHQTKITETLSPSDIDPAVYSDIVNMMHKVAGICKLELFSTEIALTSERKLLVIDPVNDQVDLRKKSSHLDGIPDDVVDRIVVNLVDWVEKQIRNALSQGKTSMPPKN
jgi:hypothetical protein